MALLLTAILNKLRVFLTASGRLLVEYFLIGVVVILGSLCVNLYMSDREAKRYVDSLSAQVNAQHIEIKQMNIANDEQTKTITALQEMRNRDSEALGGLVRDFQVLAKTNNSVDKRLKTLEQNNETVRRYLQADIPTPLICLLNKQDYPDKPNLKD